MTQQEFNSLKISDIVVPLPERNYSRCKVVAIHNNLIDIESIEDSLCGCHKGIIMSNLPYISMMDYSLQTEIFVTTHRVNLIEL